MQLIADDVCYMVVLLPSRDYSGSGIENGLKRAYVFCARKTEDTVAVVYAAGDKSMDYCFGRVER